jgi:hypothetical protein
MLEDTFQSWCCWAWASPRSRSDSGDPLVAGQAVVEEADLPPAMQTRVAGVGRARRLTDAHDAQLGAKAHQVAASSSTGIQGAVNTDGEPVGWGWGPNAAKRTARTVANLRSEGRE